MLFTSQKPHYEHLKSKWTAKHRTLQNNIWEKHGQALDWLNKTISPKTLAAGSLGGLLLLSAPMGIMPQPVQTFSRDDIANNIDKEVFVSADLKREVPEEVRKLTPSEDEKIAKILSDRFGFKVTPQLEGIGLNRTYGIIGGEQHLYRYPGDTLQAHADNATEWAMYGGSGIAPGLGAWGYFAPSKSEFTEKEKQREKYYLAVQTFLSPGFAENVGKYRDFFRFRKMLVVNPETGQAVVAVIGDAGPSEWTGKHLGGSPEVMHYLGVAGGPRKGAVLYYFIDDPEDKVPLGPISAEAEEIAKI